MDSRARDLIKIGDSLFSKKRQYDELCQELAEQFYPLRADFTSDFTLGEDFSLDLMESYPVQARETLANMIGAMLRQGDDWFAVRTGNEEMDERPEPARWLEGATKTFRNLIYDRRAKFVRATNEADHDWVLTGNPVLSVEESPTRDHFLFRSWHPKTCAWMENSIGQIDHNQRAMKMTARTMKQRWGKTIHQDVKTACEKDPTTTFTVRHVVLPVEELYGDDRKAMRRFKGMPFASIYIDKDHETYLGEGGLPVFNYVIPRWRTISNCPFGFSPATINALPDGRMIQTMARILLEQGEKAVDPPMLGKGEIFANALNLYAGGFTPVDLDESDDIRKVFQTVDVGGNIALGMEMKQDVRNLIAEAFLLNRLMLPNVREMTAFEVDMRMDEFRRAALPFFGPIESEYHLPLLDTAFQMAVRNKQFDMDGMPDELSDAEVTFRFESPLNTAEGRKMVAAYQESMQIVAGSAQVDQTVPTLMDFKAMTRDAIRGTGAPADWFKDEDAQEEDEEAERTARGVQEAAIALQGGAEVATNVANAQIALREAGMA